jgi:hypothetical protein
LHWWFFSYARIAGRFVSSDARAIAQLLNPLDITQGFALPMRWRGKQYQATQQL